MCERNTVVQAYINMYKVVHIRAMITYYIKDTPNPFLAHPIRTHSYQIFYELCPTSLKYPLFLSQLNVTENDSRFIIQW